MNSLIDYCDWEITTRCNLECKHCIVEEKEKEVNLKGCMRIVEKLKELGCEKLNFTGGEPFVKKGFFKVLKHAYSQGLESRVLTNGILINQKNIKRIKGLVEYLGFSLEGLKCSNNKIRGEGSFERTLKAIRLTKKFDINFGIYSTINRFNINNLEKFLSFLKDLNPLNISLNQIRLRGRATENKEIYIEVGQQEIINIVKEVFPEQNFRKKGDCSIDPRKIFLTANGKFYPCIELKQVIPFTYIGEILKYNFKEKYSPSFKKIEERSKGKCPYLSLTSDKISINLIRDSVKCPLTW